MKRLEDFGGYFCRWHCPIGITKKWPLALDDNEDWKIKAQNGPQSCIWNIQYKSVSLRGHEVCGRWMKFIQKQKKEAWWGGGQSRADAALQQEESSKRVQTSGQDASCTSPWGGVSHVSSQEDTQTQTQDMLEKLHLPCSSGAHRQPPGETSIKE